jgi:hypothetical protein
MQVQKKRIRNNMFVRKSKLDFIQNELDEANAELDVMELLIHQMGKELAETRKAKAKERHPSSPKKTTTKKVEKNGK